MERRSLFRTGFTGALGLLGLTGPARATESTPRVRVAYHLSDFDRVIFVLGNIQNHIDGTGGPGNADIRLVLHGPALKAFHAIAAADNVVALSERLIKSGVGFDACANTMKAQGVKLGDLTPGFVIAEKGGVVRLAELQVQGYAYRRP